MMRSCTRTGLFTNPRTVVLYGLVQPQAFLPAREHHYELDVVTLSRMQAQAVVTLVGSERPHPGHIIEPGTRHYDTYGLGAAMDLAQAESAAQYGAYQKMPKYLCETRVSIVHQAVVIVDATDRAAHAQGVAFWKIEGYSPYGQETCAREAALLRREDFTIWRNGVYTEEMDCLQKRVAELLRGDVAQPHRGRALEYFGIDYDFECRNNGLQSVQAVATAQL